VPPRTKSGIVGGLAPAALDERVAIVGTSGSGKALALDTPLPTPSGWTTMGEVKIGDQLLDEQGQPCHVTFVTEVQHGRDCFEVQFSDGTTVVADADHVWLTESYNSRIADSNAKRPEKRVNAGRGRASRPQCQRRMYPSLVTTAEISKTLTAVKGGTLERNHAVRNCLPITLPEAQLAIPPYILGCWLGDGTAQSALLTTADLEVLAEIQREGFAVGEPIQQKVGRSCAQYRIGSGPHGRKLATLLREQNLALNKHVPAAYLRGSVQQRLDLLAGLMDTDGTVAKGSNSCVFYNTRPALADAVFELTASLGWNPRITTKIGRLNGVDHSVCYTVRFRPNRQVFRLARKASLLNFEVSQAARYGHRMIDAVTPVPSVPVKCIAVDSANHLFLCTRSFVPTHNTYAAKGLVELLLTSAARICVVDPLGVWWGLRSSADGITPGFPVIVFGGRHADVPLDEGMGAALGRVVGTHESLACVVDVSELGSSAARRRFMAAFAESLYEANSEPLHLVMDEADLWAATTVAGSECAPGPD
jgi:replicative DNA helicase